MKVRYIGETSPVSLTYGEIYDVLSVEKEWYRIIDNSEEDYLYPPDEYNGFKSLSRKNTNYES